MVEQAQEWFDLFLQGVSPLLETLGQYGQHSVRMPLIVFVPLLVGLVLAAIWAGYLMGRSTWDREEELLRHKEMDYDSIRPLGRWTEEAVEARLMDISDLRQRDPESPQFARQIRQKKEDRE